MIIDYNAVNALIGSDWVYAKNDCWAIVRRASNSIFGVDLPLITIPEFSDLKANEQLFSEEAGGSKWKKLNDPIAGCAALFYNRRGNPVHVGIYIDSGNVLHCDGNVKRPGKTSYERISDIIGIKYKSVEFYEYNNHT
jgi:cell wall-associated NlpC family hydrolase